MSSMNVQPTMRPAGFGRFPSGVAGRMHRRARVPRVKGASVWRRFLEWRRERRELAALPVLSPPDYGTSPIRLDEHFAPSRYFT